MRNRRDELVDAMRGILEGRAPPTQAPTSAEADNGELLNQWITNSTARWRHRINELSGDEPGRLPLGHYRVAYLITGEIRPLNQAQLLEVLGQAVVRLSGWPPFWVPTNPAIAPYPFDGGVECWLAPPSRHQDAAHSDFWRVVPQGSAYLMRGLQEDGHSDQIEPGRFFDLTISTWRIAECLLHARRLTELIASPGARLLFDVEYGGLAGRSLATWANPRRFLTADRYQARQDTYSKRLLLDPTAIADDIATIVDEIVRPLYHLFDFFDLPATLVQEELASMRNRGV
jgi:hypothetical protein